MDPAKQIKDWWNGSSESSTHETWQPPPLKSTILKKGDSGPDIVWLRKQLNRIEGLPEDAASVENAFFDDMLEKRVIGFQQSRGVKADSIVGEQTLVQLTAAKPN